MSMIGNLVMLPQEQLDMLLKQPELIEQLLYPDLPPVAKQGFFSRLFGGAKTESKVNTIQPLLDSQQIDIDKTWHTLHFLFAGSAWEGDFPAGFLVSCGETVGDVDVGYGPARWFDHIQVAKISDYLQHINDQELRSKYIPKVLEENDIYPNIWDDRNAEDDWDYFQGGLDSIRAFLLDAKAKNMALLVYIN